MFSPSARTVPGHETNTLARAGEHTQGPEGAFTPDPKVAPTRGRVEGCIQALEAALTRAPVAVYTVAPEEACTEGRAAGCIKVPVAACILARGEVSTQAPAEECIAAHAPTAAISLRGLFLSVNSKRVG